MTSFKDFIAKYNNGSILEDAAWRAYDIEKMMTRRRAIEALKILGYRELNLFGFDRCAQDYGLRSIAQAQQLLGLWWTWQRIALGEAKRGLVRREQVHD